MLKVRVCNDAPHHAGREGLLEALCGPDGDIARIIVEQVGRCKTCICVSVEHIRGII